MMPWGIVAPVFAVFFVLALCVHGHPVVAAVMAVVSWCFASVVAVLVGVVGVLQCIAARRCRDARRSARARSKDAGARGECDRGARLVRSR